MTRYVVLICIYFLYIFDTGNYLDRWSPKKTGCRSRNSPLLHVWPEEANRCLFKYLKTLYKYKINWHPLLKFQIWCLILLFLWMHVMALANLLSNTYLLIETIQKLLCNHIYDMLLFVLWYLLLLLLLEFMLIYDRLQIKNLVSRGESFYQPLMPEIVAILESKGIYLRVCFIRPLMLLYNM